MGKNWLWCLTLAALSPHSFANSFETSYLRVELPDSWACEKIATDWACQPTDTQLLHTASLIFSAKDAAPEDTFSSLENQLKSPRTISMNKGRGTITSKMTWIRPVELSGQKWFEALHSNREIEGYFTYYLATVTPRLTVLLNFSFQQSRAKMYQPILEEIRHSVSLKKSALVAPPSAVIPQPVPVAPQVPKSTQVTPPSAEPTETFRYLLLFGIFGLAAILYFAMRRKRR